MNESIPAVSNSSGYLPPTGQQAGQIHFRPWSIDRCQASHTGIHTPRGRLPKARAAIYPRERQISDAKANDQSRKREWLDELAQCQEEDRLIFEEEYNRNMQEARL